jgi:hypothetical protein
VEEPLSELKLTEVRTKQDRKVFVSVPKTLHAGKQNWVFPLDMESLERIDSEKNPFFEYGEAAFWVAWRNGVPVGRISAQINPRHLDRYNDATGHFGYLDGVDDVSVFQALLNTAEEWLHERGMKWARGPFQLSTNEECGMLVDGFEHPPMLMMGHAEPYYSQHIAACGYGKCKDLHAFYVDTSEKRQPQIDRFLKKTENDTHIRVRSVDLKRYDEEVKLVFDIFADAWSENWGFIPFTDAEMKHISANMKLILKPELALIVEINDIPSGILIGLPNVNEAIGDLNGKLLPFGWLKILWRLKVKGLKSGRVILAGVRKEHHGTVSGFTALAAMLAEMKENANRLGYKFGELSWVLEDNKPVQRLLALGHYKPYKTYRIFEKTIS